jgi:amino acid adenylation domain-containing protein
VEMMQFVSPAVLFSLTGEDAAPMTVGELTVSAIPIRVQRSQHVLTVQLIERTDGVLYGEFRGQAAHYLPADLRRLAAEYPRCMDALLTSPNAPLATISLLGETEPETLARWSAATGPVAPALPYEAFRRWARETPEAFAAIDADGTEFSYRQLDERVAVLARTLHAEGVGVGVPVAICLPSCVDYLALTLAVWHLGGWTIPLNATDPADRIEMLLTASRAQYLVGSSGSMTADLVPLDVARLIRQDNAGPVPAAFETQPNDIAYGVFTSGTTGAPKCVAVGHGALANQLAWRRAAIGVGPGDRVLQTIPLAFDPAFWQCFGPLTAGAGVITAVPASQTAQAALVDGALSHRATIIDLVPSLLASLDDEDLGRLPARVVFCGGEALPTAQAQRYQRLGAGVLYNQYGPSETCIDAASQCVEATLAPGGTVPIGRPIGGARLYILDPALRQVPVGIPGELYVGGRGVAHGYVGHLAETAARFLPDPFAGEPGARMYRTGDRARWNSDGTVQFLGRDDDQVKIRGHRVELAELDRALLTGPAVREAAVVVVGHRFPRLAAFLAGTGQLDIGSVRAHLSTMLPGYMLPSEYRLLTSLPLTASGKVDRRRLAELASERDAPAHVPEPDPLLAIVLEAFAEVLEMPMASPEDDLHELGGTSLGAVRIAVALTARLGMEVPVRLVLRHSRAADLAAALARANAAGSPPARAEACDLAGNGVPGPQQRWLMALERHLGHPAPAISVLVEGACRLEPGRVKAAVRQLAERHDALAPLPGHPAPAPTGSWQPCVVATAPAGTDPASWWPELAERPIPDGSPGIQALVVHDRDNNPQRLLLLLARNRADGPSAVILARELRELLGGQPLPDPAPRYAEHVRSRSLRVAAERARLERYWAETLATVSPDPFDGRRPAGRAFRHHGLSWPIPAALDQQMSDRCAVLGVAPSALFLAGLARTVARAARCPQLAVGVPVGLRSGAEIDRLVGRAVDMIPVVLPADCGPVRAHRALLQALDHADLPIERIAELVDPVDVAIRPPVCAVALFTHEYDHEPAALANEEADLVDDHWSDVDLALHVESGPMGRRYLVLSGEQRIFSMPELRAMRNDLDSWLRQLCDPTTDTDGSRDGR